MTTTIPQHVAIIMDGNGRWAKARHLPRVAGHKKGFETVRQIIQTAAKKGIQVLTLFAFSSENWQRPQNEIDFLMNLFVTALKQEIKKLHENNIQLRMIGNLSRFNPELRNAIIDAQELTKNNTGMKLLIAVDYGGQWDIVNACRQMARDVLNGDKQIADITPEAITVSLSTQDLPMPDLLIRTSGEQRISNFLLWQLAYTELYFADVLWPDFDEHAFANALDFYAKRDRRFGGVNEEGESTLC